MTPIPAPGPSTASFSGDLILETIKLGLALAF